VNKFRQIDPISRNDAEGIFRNGTPSAIAVTLVRLAYHEPDWKWVQDKCIGFSSHSDVWVRRTCATCFGHIARIHGEIERDKVMVVLKRLLLDSDVKGEAEDTLEDFKVFLK
jgi:hypothetical protein